jgi:hypothetical protein
MTWFFKKKSTEKGNELVPENQDFKYEIPKKKTWLEKFLHASIDYDFKLFNTRLFIIGLIILLIAPAVATLSSFSEGEFAEGKCIKNYFSPAHNEFCSVIEFFPKNSRVPVLFKDFDNDFRRGETVHLIYLRDYPDANLILSFYGLYSNFWTGVCSGLLIIWFAGYYASRD